MFIFYIDVIFSIYRCLKTSMFSFDVPSLVVHDVPNVYYSQQVVWNLFLHHRLDADILPRGIERIAYVNADQRAESLTLTSSFSRICCDVNPSLDSVHSGPALPESELVFREKVLSDQESLKPL